MVEIRYKIEPAKHEDIDAIVTLVNQAYRGGDVVSSWTSEEGIVAGQRINSSMLTELIEAKEGELLILRDSRSYGVLGTIFAERRGHDGHIGMLTVSPRLQRQGLGTRLMNAGEEYLRKKFDCKCVVLEVLEVRPELIAWYGKRGYHKTGDTHAFPSQDSGVGVPLKPDLYFTILKKRP